MKRYLELLNLKNFAMLLVKLQKQNSHVTAGNMDVLCRLDCTYRSESITNDSNLHNDTILDIMNMNIEFS